MIGRDTFSALAPVLNWLCHPLSLFMAVSMVPNTSKYMEFELLLHATFVADDIIWGDMLEPAGDCILCSVEQSTTGFLSGYCRHKLS